MDLHEAFRRSISQYFKGKQAKEMKSLSKKQKFDKKYFDTFERNKFGDTEEEGSK